jgi:hypothetical protein
MSDLMIRCFLLGCLDSRLDKMDGSPATLVSNYAVDE